MPGLPSTTRTGNIPIPRNPLIGRSAELASALASLSDDATPLLTLTGPGGVGKTRLALSIAAELRHSFRDGVWFIPLAAVSGPDLVAPTISAALGLHDVGGVSPRDRILRFVASRQLLLVLDNFEQVVTAAPFVADLLTTAPDLQIVVTSRAILHVDGEREFPVPPLSLRRENDATHVPRLTSHVSDAVILFVQRASAVQPGFTLTPANGAAIAEICAISMACPSRSNSPPPAPNSSPPPPSSPASPTASPSSPAVAATAHPASKPCATPSPGATTSSPHPNKPSSAASRSSPPTPPSRPLKH